jgi:protein required for attachment to host cells
LDEVGSVMKRIITWILVADGSQARRFCNDGPGRGVAPLSDDLLTGRNLPGREIMSDRPGRTFDSVGQGRHAKEPRADPRAVEKRRFAHTLAAILEDGLNQGRFDCLVLVAPPRTLGLLRDELSKSLREKSARSWRRTSRKRRHTSFQNTWAELWWFEIGVRLNHSAEERS